MFLFSKYIKTKSGHFYKWAEINKRNEIIK
jgi:hypothetical protein